MRTKDEILTALKRLAAELGETPGRSTFQKRTEIKRHEWYGLHWRNYTELTQEAGLVTNRPPQKVPSCELCRAVFELAAELNHVPSMSDMELKRRSVPDFPTRQLITKRLGKEVHRAKAVLEWANDTNQNPEIANLFKAVYEAKNHLTDEAPSAVGKVYLLEQQSPRRLYKVGLTNDTRRRLAQISGQSAYPIELVHEIFTDDPQGLERYWHERWKRENKHFDKEWFSLSRSDVSSFKKMRHFAKKD